MTFFPCNYFWCFILGYDYQWSYLPEIYWFCHSANLMKTETFCLSHHALLFPLQRYGKFSHQNFASNVCSWKQLLLKLVQTKFISIFINVFELVIGPSLKWNPAVVLGFVKISLIDLSLRFDFWVGGRGSRPISMWFPPANLPRPASKCTEEGTIIC